MSLFRLVWKCVTFAFGFALFYAGALVLAAIAIALPLLLVLGLLAYAFRRFA